MNQNQTNQNLHLVTEAGRVVQEADQNGDGIIDQQEHSQAINKLHYINSLLGCNFLKTTVKGCMSLVNFSYAATNGIHHSQDIYSHH